MTDRDPLAPYADALSLWRMTFLDLPLAFAAAFDAFMPGRMAYGAAHWTRLARCASPGEVVAAQARFASDTLAAGRHAAEALARDVEVTVETGIA